MTERGLKLFEQITYLKDYYLTNAEIEVLETQADKIAQRIPQGCRLVELGSGYVCCTACPGAGQLRSLEVWCGF